MNNFSTWSGSYIPNYAAREQTLKNIIDQASRELSAIQNPQYPTNLTQNFQITPAQTNTSSNLLFKIVDSLEDVNNEIVLNDTYFLSKNKDCLWMKDSKGNIRTFNIKEIVPKTEKDLIIEDLQNQINELKRGMNNVNSKYDGSNGYTKNDDSATANKSTNVQSVSSGAPKKH